MTAPTRKTTAATTYRSRYAQAQGQLAHLASLLEAHKADQDKFPENWGFAGDLGKVTNDLQEIIAFLAKTEE